MRHATRAAAVLLLLAGGWPVPGGRVAAAADGEQDRYEEQAVDRVAGRLSRFLNTERGRWVKELENAFPGRVADPTRAAEYGQWFELLAGGGTEWRRADAPTTGVAALFDRVRERRELGPVPTIRRDEFMRYVDRVLVREVRRARERLPDPDEAADRVFRTLDTNADDILERAEMTTPLREGGRRADADLNGRIDRDEYRLHFRHRVQVRAETAPPERGDDRRGSGAATQPPEEEDELPEWFTELDVDEDGQVALHEWRKAGRLLDSFTEMDLDGDGLLTPEEYLRYVRMQEKVPPDEPPPVGQSGKK